MTEDEIKFGFPINDPESAVGAGWFVEVDGKRIAELVEPRGQRDSPGWLSYVIVPTTDDEAINAQLLTMAFWDSGKASFRSRKFGALAENVLISSVPPCPKTHRLIARGFRIYVDPGPSIIERIVSLFRKKTRNAEDRS